MMPMPRRGLLLAGVAVLPLEGLDDQAGLDGLGGGQDAGGDALDNRCHLLEVRAELPAGDPRGLETEPALADLLAAVNPALAIAGPLAGEMALVRHWKDSDWDGKDRREGGKSKGKRGM